MRRQRKPLNACSDANDADHNLLERTRQRNEVTAWAQSRHKTPWMFDRKRLSGYDRREADMWTLLVIVWVAAMLWLWAALTLAARPVPKRRGR
jgi:hypothetical protein